MKVVMTTNGDKTSFFCLETTIVTLNICSSDFTSRV